MKNRKIRINMILLAAGNSQRFGSNKLLWEFEGKPLYMYTLNAVLGAVEILNQHKKIYKIDCNIIIVTQYREILDCGEGLGLITVENKRPEAGISYSIKLGLQKVRLKAAEFEASQRTVRKSFQGEIDEKYMFFVCDQPFLKGERVVELIIEYLRSGKSMGALSYGGQYGNPCIFDESRVAELMNLDGDTGGKKILLLNCINTFSLECQSEIELRDIDFLP